MLLSKIFTSVSPTGCLRLKVYKVWPIANVYRTVTMTLNTLGNSSFKDRFICSSNIILTPLWIFFFLLLILLICQ